MADLWDGDIGDASAFELPGDADKVGVEPAPQDTPAEPEPQVSEVEQRPRDEHGRFMAQAEEQEEVQEFEAEEPAAEMTDWDRRIAEKDAMIGRQSTEVGELRQQLAQYEEYLQQQSQAQFQQQYPGQGGGQDWEGLIDQNPAQATEAAWEQGNQQAFYAAAQAWEELAPGAPKLWYENLGMKHTLAELTQSNQRQQAAHALSGVIQQYPDFASEEVQDKIIEILPQYPYEGRALTSNDPREVAAAAQSLYLKATRGLPQNADTLVQKVQETAQRLAHDEQRAINEASVVSASRTQKEPALSAAQRIAESWAADEDRLNSGWNIS